MEPNPLAIWGMCLGGAGALIFLFWLNHKIRTRPRSVKRFQGGTTNIMSHSPQEPRDLSPSDLQTRPQTAQDQTEDAQARREKLLYTYGVLRKRGFSREEARAMLNTWGIPLDNNLWSKAAPVTEEPQEKAPISGRAIPAGVRFHEDDPELEYKPLR